MYDVIVVGAGVMGSATAYHLAKRGSSVLLLEQFYLPHSRGSSHGQSRIVRNVYREDFLTKMASESLRMWKELEAEGGAQIVTTCGMLLFGDDEDARTSFVHQAEANLLKYGLDFDKLGAAALRLRFPSMRFGDTHIGILDTHAGTLHADVALKTFHDVTRRLGGSIRDGEGVERVEEHSDAVTITTSKSVYAAKKVVLTPGPWASDLLALIGVKLPLETLRIQVCYWREKVKGSHDVSRFPAFVEASGSPPAMGSDIYGLPADEYPGYVKICFHNGVGECHDPTGTFRVRL